MQQTSNDFEPTRAEVLIYKIFAESAEGKELLEEFKKSLLTMPADRLGNDLYSLGKEEGRKDFMRNIINTINKIGMEK